MLKLPIKKLFILAFIILLLQAQSYATSNIDKGANCLYKASIAMTQQEKDFYLNKALSIYQNEYDNNKLNIQAMIGLGRAYTQLGERTNAKSILMQAYNIYSDKPQIHVALADFYYYFQEYNTAIEFYKLALSSGYLKDFNTNISTALCYEKLGDLQNAKLYYKIALMLNPNSNTAREKLLNLESNINSSALAVPTVFQDENDDASE